MKSQEIPKSAELSLETIKNQMLGDIKNELENFQKNIPQIEKNKIIANNYLKKSLATLEKGKIEGFLQDRYILSVIFYGTDFLEKELNRKNPIHEILYQINKRITQKQRNDFLNFLKKKCINSKIDFSRKVSPFEGFQSPNGGHPNALDLFVAEGTPIKSIAGGVVILSENGWKKGEKFATSSEMGGNIVVIFNPKSGQFYRYCHLQSTNSKLKPGMIIPAGEIIGKVGHTGLNATQPGHGSHLHLEITTPTSDGKVIPKKNYEIQKMLNSIRSQKNSK